MLYIGIDPGVNTGLAVWDGHRFTEVVTASIVGAMRIILQYAAEHPVTLVVEDARKRKYLPRERSNAEYRGRLMGAGSVKRDCAIWEEFAAYYDILIEMPAPRPGLTKWDAAYWEKVTGWKGRTSNHARDAAMLVFGK